MGLDGTARVHCSGSRTGHREWTWSLAEPRGSAIQRHWAVCSVCPSLFWSRMPVSVAPGEDADGIKGEWLPHCILGFTPGYVNRGSNVPGSQSRGNHMKKKIYKWCPFVYRIVSVGAAIMNYHRVGGLWTADISFSQSWRLEVWEQAPVRSGEGPLPGDRQWEGALLLGYSSSLSWGLICYL